MSEFHFVCTCFRAVWHPLAADIPSRSCNIGYLQYLSSPWISTMHLEHVWELPKKESIQAVIAWCNTLPHGVWQEAQKQKCCCGMLCLSCKWSLFEVSELKNCSTLSGWEAKNSFFQQFDELPTKSWDVNKTEPVLCQRHSSWGPEVMDKHSIHGTKTTLTLGNYFAWLVRWWPEFILAPSFRLLRRHKVMCIWATSWRLKGQLGGNEHWLPRAKAAKCQRPSHLGKEPTEQWWFQVATWKKKRPLRTPWTMPSELVNKSRYQQK